MRRTILYVAGWAAAGVSAVALATVAVSMVGNQVTSKRPAALSVGEVRTELSGDADLPTVTVAGDVATTMTVSDSSVPSRPTAPTSTGPTATTPTTKPTASTVTTDPGSSSTTQPSPPASIRSYSLVGGTVTLRFSSSAVTVQEATPRPGYSVEVEPTHGNGVRVEFRSGDRRSRVTGWWENGPRDEVDEDH